MSSVVKQQERGDKMNNKKRENIMNVIINVFNQNNLPVYDRLAMLETVKAHTLESRILAKVKLK